jgi:hypothetical protein
VGKIQSTLAHTTGGTCDYKGFMIPGICVEIQLPRSFLATRFEVFTVVTKKIAVFGGVLPFSLLSG